MLWTTFIAQSMQHKQTGQPNVLILTAPITHTGQTLPNPESYIPPSPNCLPIVLLLTICDVFQHNATRGTSMSVFLLTGSGLCTHRDL